MGKNIRTSEAAPVKRGDRQPERQSLVVSQRQCFGLVVYLPLHRSLPPTRGTTACPAIVAHITKHGPRSRCGRSLALYSPDVVCTPGLYLPVTMDAGARQVQWGRGLPDFGSRGPEERKPHRPPMSGTHLRR